MKLTAIFASLALVTAVPLASCAGMGGGVIRPVDQQAATKALISAEAAFAAAVQAERAAKASGALTGERAEQADALVQRAYAALLLARQTYGVNKTANVANLLALIASLTALINGAPA